MSAPEHFAMVSGRGDRIELTRDTIHDGPVAYTIHVIEEPGRMVPVGGPKRVTVVLSPEDWTTFVAGALGVHLARPKLDADQELTIGGVTASERVRGDG